MHGVRQSTIGIEIVLDTPDDTPSFEAHEETHFSPLGDSANVESR
jgi:hypothetical protein